jgi:DNA-binding NarL/FixJ family response regulator
MGLKPEMPRLRVVTIMALIVKAQFQTALELGVDGLLVPPFSEVECLSVLRGVMAGGFGVQRGALHRLVAGSADTWPGSANAIPLKPAEANIIDLLAQGLRYKEVADRLDISKAKMKRLTGVRDKILHQAASGRESLRAA